MKKFTKLFLLALCSGFLFLGPVNAEDLVEENFYKNEYDANQDGGFHSEGIVYNPSVYGGDSCSHFQCEVNFLGLLCKRCLLGICTILGIILIILTVRAVVLYKKSEDILDLPGLLYIPILNLYPISKATIGKPGFFFLILLIGFFCYSVFRNLHENKCCFDFPSWQDYAGIIVGIITIIILSALIFVLKPYRKDSNEESPNEQK